MPRFATVRVVLAVLGVVALTLPACGRPTTSGLPPLADSYAPTARIPEDPPRWAQVGLDACKLLTGPTARTIASGPPFASGPHSCELPVSLPGGHADRVVVALGANFVHHNRSAAAPVTIGGLTAYQLVDGPTTRAPELRTCDIHIPLSATTAIRVHGRATGDDLVSGCSYERAAAESVATRLADPTEAASGEPPTAIGRWDLCALLGKALDTTTQVRFGVGRDGIAGSACATHDPRAGSNWADTELTVIAGTDPLPDAPPTARAKLSFAEVRRTGRERGCDVEWALGPVAGAPPDRAVLRMKLARNNEPNACDTALGQAEQVVRILTTPPEAPKAPTTLGFRPGTPDEAMSSVCQLDAQATPVDCRAPTPIELPDRVEKLIDSYNRPGAPDVACALLGTLLKDATGQDGETAVRREYCQGGVSDHSLILTLRFYPTAAEVWHRCDRTGTTSVAGRTVTVCATNGPRRDLMIPTNAGSPYGMIRVTTTETTTRGINAPAPTKSDRLTLADRMAEALLDRYRD